MVFQIPQHPAGVKGLVHCPIRKVFCALLQGLHLQDQLDRCRKFHQEEEHKQHRIYRSKESVEKQNRRKDAAPFPYKSRMLPAKPDKPFPAIRKVTKKCIPPEFLCVDPCKQGMQTECHHAQFHCYRRNERRTEIGKTRIPVIQIIEGSRKNGTYDP